MQIIKYDVERGHCPTCDGVRTFTECKFTEFSYTPHGLETGFTGKEIKCERCGGKGCILYKIRHLNYSLNQCVMDIIVKIPLE